MNTNEQKIKSKSNISLASNQNTHPWYYVPGNRSETEKRISSKMEKYLHKQLENEQNYKYFKKCNSDMKLFSNWEKSKPLVRYNNDSLLNCPFYIENKSQRILNENDYINCFEKVKDLFKNYNNVCLKYKTNSIDCSIILKFLLNFFELYKLAHIKRKTCIGEIKLHFIQPKKYVHDPLRNVCFLIKELLYFYKKEIFNIIKMLKPICASDFLNESELKNLHEINNRAFQIINMYIQLNEIRNGHFQQMYNEEKERIWGKQMNIWKEEIVIWDGLMIKLLKSNYLLIKDKLQLTLANKKASFDVRLEKFEQLKYFIDEFRQDNNLNSILYLNIDQISE